MMHVARRRVIGAGLKTGAALSLLAVARVAPAATDADWNKAAFDARTSPEALRALGASGAEKSAAVSLSAPDIAENGAVVPVVVQTGLPNVDQIAILVDKNPNVLSAIFAIPAGTEAFVSTRVKMAQTANVMALVHAGGKWYSAAREVKVTIGGCGG